MILKILKVFAGAVLFLNASIAIAAELDHYEVKASPEKVAVWEAIDLTIEAVDKDNNVIKDYEWTVLIFSESDKQAEFPKTIEENSYTFSKSDEWSVKFENAIKFTKPWKHDIHVYDLNDQTDSIFWLAEIEVSEETKEEKIDIEILTPPTGTTIGSKKINISWKSKKNYQIKIVLNNKEEILTTTNKDWIFEKEISNLENWENVIQAYILNSDWDKIGKSKEVLIKSDSSLPVLNKVKLTPDEEIQAKTKILAEVYATEWLSEVSLILNDSINILKEDTAWIYKWEFLAPKEEWEYKIDIILKNELGSKVEKKATKILKVIPKLTVAPTKTGSIVKKDKCPKWDYTWDVFDWKCWEKPENYEAPIDLWIRNLKIVQLKTKSVLTWDKLKDAIKYEVYKKMSGNKLELIDTVTKPKYEILITWDEVKYEYFAVKAIWKQEFVDSEDSTKKIEKEIIWDLSDAVKIQTWPKEIIIVLIALLLWFGIFFIWRRKA